MGLLNRKIPVYMYEKSNLVRLVLFTALFALVFINIYKPFSSSYWYPVSEFKFFLFSSLIILNGVLVVVISRIIMYHYVKSHFISYGQYGLWISGEIFLMALFYTIYTLSLKEEKEVLDVFKDSMKNTSLVLLLPYAILMLYFSKQEKERQLRRLEEGRADVGGKGTVLSFYDEKEELRLSVKRNNLLYMESADNYVFIWYLNKGIVTRFMLRNTLKNIEKHFINTTVLRCHRSYMVNFEQVKVIRRGKDGIYLELGVDKVPDIPISKTYSEKVTRWFMSYSS